MDIRKDPLVNDHYYHIFSRSIAKFVIFNCAEDYLRFMEILELYQYKEFEYRYSRFKKLSISNQSSILTGLKNDSPKCIDIISHSLMPTHIHLLLKQLTKNGISKYMAKVLNSYSKYFNTKYHRKGPLWEGRFKSVLVASDEQLLHLTRYMHLNASSAGIVDDPFEWQFSSLKEYTAEIDGGICEFRQIIDMTSERYKKFVLDQKSYQRSLSLIKNILIDNYSG